ncbi:hypothetical protein S245_011291 [Arachis hypogaea]
MASNLKTDMLTMHVLLSYPVSLNSTPIITNERKWWLTSGKLQRSTVQAWKYRKGFTSFPLDSISIPAFNILQSNVNRHSLYNWRGYAAADTRRSWEGFKAFSQVGLLGTYPPILI